MSIHSITIILLSSFVLMACSEQKISGLEEDGWTTESQVLKTIENINFNFPASGYAFDNKSDFVDECFDALQSNLQLLKLDEFTDTIQIRFLSSREDMSLLTGRKATGIAYPHLNTLYVVADSTENVKPPIKHELLHLIAMLKWGYPHYSSTWINEGFATYAENNCNGFNVAEIYRYFMETEQVIHIDSLTQDFYKQPEMVSYHQSAYVAEYLHANYSIDQFKRLWTEGYNNFEAIYGIDFQEVKTKLEKSVVNKYPKAPKVDWETFKEGCKK